MIAATGSRVFPVEVFSANGVSTQLPGPKNPAVNERQYESSFKSAPLMANAFPGGSVPAASTTSELHPDRARQELLSQELKEITSLYNISVAVGSSLNLEEVIGILYKESGRLINTSNLAIVLYDERASTLNFALAYERGKQVKPCSIKLNYQDSFIGRILTSRTPLLIPDLQANNSVDTDHLVRSWLGVPILNPDFAQESAQGVMVLWSYEPNAFTEHDLWLLSAICTQAAIAIRNARLHEAVLAERDRVIAAEEQARRALAHELHDGPTQLVSALTMRLDFCRMLLSRDLTRLAPEIEAMTQLAHQAVHQIRTLLFELRPLALETQGLQSAVQMFVERRQEDVGEQPHLSLEVETSQPEGQVSRQDEPVEAALFAIIQETVNNALKHSQAQNIVVRLRETLTAFWVTISDDGKGFDVAGVMNGYEQRGSLGMVNLRERADLIGGELSLESVPGEGTRVVVRVSKNAEDRSRKRGATGPLRLRREG